MKFMGKGGMKAGVKTKENQGTFQFLSQLIDKNNTYRVFYPITKLNGTWSADGEVFTPAEGVNLEDQFDIQAITLPGYKADLDAMGTTFLPIEDYEENSVGQVHDSGPMPTCARVARVLFDAQYERDVKLKETQMTSEAEAMGSTLNPSLLNEAQEAIKIEYYGTKVNGVNVPPKKNQALQSLRVYIFTAGAIYALNSDGIAVPGCDIDSFSLDLNAKKTTQLDTAVKKAMQERKARLLEIKNKKLTGEVLSEEEENYKHMLDKGYIEVEYVYNGADKKAAGMSATFQYCSEKSDASCFKFKDFWAKESDNILSRLVYDMNTMAAKNRNISMAPTVEKVYMNFLAYCADNFALGNYVNTEDDTVKRAAADMLKIDGFKKNPNFYQKLETIVAEKESNPSDSDDEMTDEELKTATAVGAIVGASTGGHASLSEIMAAAGGDGSGIDDATAGEPGEL